LPDPEVMRQVMGDFFQVPVPTIQRMEKDLPFPDLNLPVALFIAQRARVSVDLLISWRKAGQSWLHIAERLKLPPTIFFVAVPEGKIGPPYGRAYGHYWKHKKNRNYRIVLSDEEVADLVHLRIASSYFGLPPSQIVALRVEGKRFPHIYGQEYRKRHGPAGKGGPHPGSVRGRPERGGGPGKPGKGRGGR
jgi:hypothetical protein